MEVHSSSLTGNSLSLCHFFSLGTFLGSLCTPVLSHRYGGKLTIIVFTLVLFIIGTLLRDIVQKLKVLIVGRVISGVGIGLISAVVPLYQVEATEKKN